MEKTNVKQKILNIITDEAKTPTEIRKEMKYSITYQELISLLTELLREEAVYRFQVKMYSYFKRWKG